MDLEILRRAREAGTRIAYLEPIEHQLALIEKVMTIEMLADFLDDADGQRQKLERMTKAYLGADVEKLAQVVFDPEDMKKFPGMTELLIYKRNREWLPLLEQHILAGRVFVAVGAAHLIGEKGILALLAQNGHDLSRAPIPAKN